MPNIHISSTVCVCFTVRSIRKYQMHQTFFPFSLNDHDPRCRERKEILLPSYGIGDAMVRWQLPPSPSRFSSRPSPPLFLCRAPLWVWGQNVVGSWRTTHSMRNNLNYKFISPHIIYHVCGCVIRKLRRTGNRLGEYQHTNFEV